jgi:hypothetical protein
MSCTRLFLMNFRNGVIVLFSKLTIFIMRKKFLVWAKTDGANVFNKIEYECLGYTQ